MARKNADVFQSSAGQIAGLVTDMLRIRDELGITPDEFHVLFTQDGEKHLEKMIMDLKTPAAETPKPVYLRRLYPDEDILLAPTDGTKTIAQAKNVFSWGIDSDFTNWNLNVMATKTTTTKVSVHEMFERDGTFAEIYGSLGHPLDRLCLTQHQIINFCVMHKDKLRQEGYATFFLFKVGGKFFVADVGVDADGTLCARVDHFSDARAWRAECRRRFVIPQL
jgi:hypothetical protein